MTTYKISHRLIDPINGGFIAIVELTPQEFLHVRFDSDMNVIHAFIDEISFTKGYRTSTQKLVYAQVEII